MDPTPTITCRPRADLLLPVVSDRASVAPIIALLVPGSSGVLPDRLIIAVQGLVLAGAAITAARALLHRRYRPAAEVTLLVALGLLVPPLAAFGAYFGGWHAVRTSDI